ncbi:MAG: anti-sigma factor [Anaerolineae bacterium]|nr:anti-sigma factor [Anaerolineae bacterium]MCI0609897.1 anti-sigma factor [Anaerolineae bacterium]
MIEDMHVLESLPAYALGSLDEAEARLVAEHLTSCHMCRAELSAFQDVADQLAFAAPDTFPSQNLRHRFLERLREIKSTRPQPERFRVTGRLIPIGGMVRMLLIFLLLVSNLVLWQRLNHLEVLAGPMGMRAIALQNTDAAPNASGFVIISSDGREGVLVVDELPQLDAQHEYQLWLVRNGSTTSGAVFPIDESGYRGTRIEAPQTLLLYSSVRVTIEPTGGSPEPTGKQVLGGSLFNP